jgi:hypothetical protein
MDLRRCIETAVTSLLECVCKQDIFDCAGLGYALQFTD